MKITDCKVELIDSMGTDISVVDAARFLKRKVIICMMTTIQVLSIFQIKIKNY